ncbi:MAG: PD-(D/E)XK nuclease family protein [Verrucomicrobia bacterium]|nr:PD-(D/E)XK nuclease family protein [Verrucomicrobiota bacterium]
MARITVTQLKHASLDKNWRDAWILNPSLPVPIVRAPKNSVRVNSSLFHRLVDQFSNWLTAEPNLRTTARLSRYEDVWDAFWNNFAKKELLELLQRQGPESADRLTKALKNWSQELVTKRAATAPFKNWRSLILTSEYQFDDVAVSTAHGIVHVAGRPDCVVLETGGPVVVDYKLSRGANLKTDLLQAAIYAVLLQRTHPGLSVSARLEYYEPELYAIAQGQDQVKNLFDELVAPTLAEVAAHLATTSPQLKSQVRSSEQTPPTPDLGPAIVDAYRAYGVTVQVLDRLEAPQLIRYRLQMGEGVKFSQIEQHSTNLKIALSLPSEPMISAGPGFVFFDVAKPEPDTVVWSAVMDLPGLRQHPSATAFPVGINVDNQPIIADLSDPNMAHALVAGTSGSGKSEFLRTTVAALAARNSPAHLKFSLIDPKRLTFGVIQNSRYLAGPVIFSLEKALVCLTDAAEEMDRRYEVLLQEGFTKLSDRFATGKKDIPFRVIVLDEFADLVHAGKQGKKKFELLVARISAKGRAAGVHLIVTTQRPDRETVSGLLKANLPLRICFRVTNAINSSIVLDQAGAEKLLGRGDFLCDRGKGLERGQAALIPPDQFEKAFAPGR